MANRKQYPLEPLFGRILSPFEEFMRRTTAGATVLLLTTGVALVLASSLGQETLEHFWERRAAFSAGGFRLELSLHRWVNDGLMALFFLLVGLELKREILVGELASLKDAALPVVGAAGGMAIPALIYVAFNAGRPTDSGWGIPMATDIAFAVGIMVMLAWRVPRNAIVFLTALAIADDLGAVLVIALFYTSRFDPAALSAVAVLFGVLLLFNRGGIRSPLPYALVGIVLWYAVLVSGIHATISGILLAAAIPARPRRTPAEFERRIGELQSAFHDERDADAPSDPLGNHRMAAIARAMERSASAVQSPLQRMEHELSPWVTFVVIPLFALSNAATDLTAIRWDEALASRVTLGVTLGLFLGKFAGIGAFSWLAVRMGFAKLPSGVQWKHILGAAWLGGIGFTMSLFIAQLALHEPRLIGEAKLGILLASAASALTGLAWLYLASRRK